MNTEEREVFEAAFQNAGRILDALVMRCGLNALVDATIGALGENLEYLKTLYYFSLEDVAVIAARVNALQIELSNALLLAERQSGGWSLNP